MDSKVLEDYKELVIEINKLDRPVSIKKLDQAWGLAQRLHKDQRRKNNEPYIVHLLETTKILASWKVDETTLIAGLLHDVLRETDCKAAELEKLFGSDVRNLIETATLVADIRLYTAKSSKTVENLRKLLLVMSKDLRVVLIRLANQMHNMRTLYILPEEKQKRISRETLDIYAPLAERLGLGVVKGELSDLSFKYLYPRNYSRLIKESASEYKKAEKHILVMKKKLLVAFAENNIKSNIQSRKKSYFSLWKKLKRKDVTGFSDINDIVAMRILVDTKEHCYAVLGLLHSIYKPVPYLGISDFIAQPKPNGYQSIHTKVFGPEKRIIEVQIRTHDMHEQAEYGIASHWAYAEAKSQGVSDDVLEKGGVKVDAEKLSWVRELIKWQEEITDSQKYLEAVKFDALSHRNFVFTPAGDVIDLPEGATPIDFAAAVHTKLLNFVERAKVNGRVVPLNYKLKSGDVVEIEKRKQKKPLNRDWLAFVKTNLAKSEINKAFNKKD